MVATMKSNESSGIPLWDATISTGSILISFISMVLELPTIFTNVIDAMTNILQIPAYATAGIIGLIFTIIIFGLISSLTKHDT